MEKKEAEWNQQIDEERQKQRELRMSLENEKRKCQYKQEQLKGKKTTDAKHINDMNSRPWKEDRLFGSTPEGGRRNQKFFVSDEEGTEGAVGFNQGYLPNR